MATRLRFNISAFRAIRTAPGVRRDIARRAEAVADAAGDGYLALHASNPRNRARSAVVAATGEAQRDNARRQTLLRALNAGR